MAHSARGETDDDLNVYENTFSETGSDHCSQAASFFEPEPHLPIPHYSEHEAVVVANKLEQQYTFHEGLTVLLARIKNGEWCEENADTLVSITDSLHARGCQLMNEKEEHEKKVDEMNAKLSEKIDTMLLEFSEIAQLFTIVMRPEVLSRFTGTQRKTLKYLKSVIEKQEGALVEEVLHDSKKVHDYDKKVNHQKMMEMSGSQQQCEFESKLRNIENLRKENITPQGLLEASQDIIEEKEKEVQDMQLPSMKVEKDL